jgi:hypothetical protein
VVGYSFLGQRGVQGKQWALLQDWHLAWRRRRLLFFALALSALVAACCSCFVFSEELLADLFNV